VGVDFFREVGDLWEKEEFYQDLTVLYSDNPIHTIRY
jgi:hypothetical protein